MADDLKFTVHVAFDNDGKPKFRKATGGGGGGPRGTSASSASAERAMRGGGGGGSNTGDAGGSNQASIFSGRPTSAFMFTAPGFAMSSIASSMFDPTVSGAQQDLAIQREGGRLAGFGMGSAAARAHGTELTSPGMAEQVGNTVGEAVAAAVEKTLGLRAQASQAALGTTQGALRSFAASGVDIGDEQIKSLLDTETAAQNRVNKMNLRVAKASGNTQAGELLDNYDNTENVADVVERVGSGLISKLKEAITSVLPGGGNKGTGGGLFNPNAFEEGRRLAEQNARGNAAIGAGSANLPMNS